MKNGRQNPPHDPSGPILSEVVGMDAHSRKIVLCRMRRENGRLSKLATIHTTVSALESTRAKNVPEDVPTVLEASINSSHIAKRLVSTGRKAFVFASDVLSGLFR